MFSRREFLKGLVATAAGVLVPQIAPAIVHAENIMRIRPITEGEWAHILDGAGFSLGKTRYWLLDETTGKKTTLEAALSNPHSLQMPQKYRIELEEILISRPGIAENISLNLPNGRPGIVHDFSIMATMVTLGDSARIAPYLASFR